MIDLGTAIKRIAASVDKPGVARSATDENVIRKMEEMAAAYGFVPESKHVEPIRAYLSGYALVLHGDTGAGKTFLMRALGARLYDARRIVSYGLRIDDWYRWTDGFDVCIDDLGTEPMVNEYGNKAEIMAEVVAHRERLRGVRTHVTMNINAEQVASRYGERTLSRILGMGSVHKLKGPSRREPVAVVTSVVNAANQPERNAIG
jgi:DNA replication protein DnaC